MINQTLTEAALKLNLTARKRFGLSQDTTLLPPIILMTDEHRVPDPAPAIENLSPGSAVIYRHYGISDRANFGSHLRDIARRRDVLFLVAGDPELAETLDADGLHMPENLGFQLEEGIQQNAHRWPITTVAAHSGPALERAYEQKATAALLSPVFATKSHPHDEALGAAKANDLAATAPLPVYALGGLDEKTVEYLSLEAFAGIAAIGALSP